MADRQVILLAAGESRRMGVPNKLLLEIGGVPNPEKRYKVVVPENLDKFPRALSLACLLYTSPSPRD